MKRNSAPDLARRALLQRGALLGQQLDRATRNRRPAV